MNCRLRDIGSMSFADQCKDNLSSGSKHANFWSKCNPPAFLCLHLAASVVAQLSCHSSSSSRKSMETPSGYILPGAYLETNHGHGWWMDRIDTEKGCIMLWFELHEVCPVGAFLDHNQNTALFGCVCASHAATEAINPKASKSSNQCSSAGSGCQRHGAIATLRSRQSFT